MFPQFRKVSPVPSIQATDITFSSIGASSMEVSWTRGNGLQVAVVAKQGSAVDAFLLSNSTYVDDDVFGDGSEIGTGNFIVYIGTGESVTVNGLTNLTDYHFKVIEFNGVAGAEKYNNNSATGNPASETTLDEVFAPTVQAQNLRFEGDRQLYIDDRGNGSKVLILHHVGAAVDANPSDDTTYNVGDEIGTDNFVIYVGTGDRVLDLDDLGFATNNHFRAYEFNGGAGEEKYNITTDTGNPLEHDTPAEEEWFLHHEPIAYGYRGTPHPEDDSFSCSKAYSGAFAESSDEFQLFTTQDNNANAFSPPHYDQQFLWVKDKADGLPFHQGWSQVLEAGIPKVVLNSLVAEGTATTEWYRGQQWLATPRVIADDDYVAYYSANTISGSRYAVGRATSDDKGRTWVRDPEANPVIDQGPGETYWQFHHYFYDSDLSTHFLIGPNMQDNDPITQGRIGSMNIWSSADGLAWTKVSSNIYDGTQIDEEGFCLQGPIWKDGGKYYWTATVTPVDDFRAFYSNPTLTVYPWMNRDVVLVSCEDITVADPEINIERVLFRNTSQHGAMGLYPSSRIIPHDGAEYLIVNSFTWQATEDAVTTFAQPPMDVKVMKKGTAVSGSVAAYATNDTYPSWLFGLLIPHQTNLDDTFESTSISPIDAVTGVAGTVVGTPTQHVLEKIYVSNGNYVTFPCTGFDTSDFGVKTVSFFNQLDNVERCILEKVGSFRMFMSDSKRLEVWIYGAAGALKKYRSVATNTTQRTDIFVSDYQVFGFTWKSGVLKLHVDYSTEIAVTMIQDDAFTDMVDNANPVKLGHDTVYPPGTVAGRTLIMSGADVSTANWLNNNLC